VADDDLSAPLGQSTRKKRRRFTLPIRLSHLVAGALSLFLLVVTIWAVAVDDPLGGEPIAMAATGFDTKPVGAKPAEDGALQGSRAADGATAPGPKRIDVPAQTPMPGQGPVHIPAPAAPNGKTVTIIDGSTGQRQEVPIPASGDAPRAPPEQRLLEVTRHGAIPRIGSDGTRPSEAYARATKLQRGKDGPKVAIVVGGLGVSTTATKLATAKLPGAVTFAFIPYSAGVDGLVTTARAAGHEILLQAPMEPFDYPDNDPGPQTLLTTLSADQNIDRLHWLMSRFQGYVGIAGHKGARFTATEAALAPVLKETAKRGLIYLDDGSSPRSLAGQIAANNNLPFAKSEIALDAVTTPAHIDQALARLEAMSKEHGSAVGLAQALPVSIERIAQWAKAAQARGIVLVPITAIAIKPTSS
jgi:polysaccharide deacetylase 2 family uncharacterized protein YibQ